MHFVPSITTLVVVLPMLDLFQGGLSLTKPFLSEPLPPRKPQRISSVTTHLNAVLGGLQSHPSAVALRSTLLNPAPGAAKRSAE